MIAKIRKFVIPCEITPEVAVIVGTRPGIIMLAPVVHELARRQIPHFVIHTGQHYSPALDAELFEDLSLRQPDFRLAGVAEKRTHGGQTAAMIEGTEAILIDRRPALVLVNGDANTNLAAALAARKLRLGVGHIEAGERSFDWRMPEEHNRRMMDHISDLLFTTSAKAAQRLALEHVQGEVHVTGNTIVDASINHGRLALARSDLHGRLGLRDNEYVLVTAHREENVDDPAKLEAILRATHEIASRSGLKVVAPLHPRTRGRIAEFGLGHFLAASGAPMFLDAVRYLDFMQLLISARLVLTDSGGVQQEAYIHRKPCVTLRDNTEWTETLESGANRLAGADDPEAIAVHAMAAMSDAAIAWSSPFGDGKAAERIVEISAGFLQRARPSGS